MAVQIFEALHGQLRIQAAPGIQSTGARISLGRRVMDSGNAEVYQFFRARRARERYLTML
jgi:hypothetical protein